MAHSFSFEKLNRINGTSGGSVLARLKYLQNPDNRNYAGRCCGRSIAGTCQPCDYQLSIWLTCDCKTVNSDCLYGMGKTKLFNNASEIKFPDDLGNGTRNPLEHKFISFQVRLDTPTALVTVHVAYDRSKKDIYKIKEYTQLN